jgi:hypothetical protein
MRMPIRICSKAPHNQNKRLRVPHVPACSGNHGKSSKFRRIRRSACELQCFARVSTVSKSVSRFLTREYSGSRVRVDLVFTGVIRIQDFGKHLEINKGPVRFRPSP